MKTNIVLLLAISTMLIACNKGETVVMGDFEFFTEYSTTVTVGGFVGITKRTFNAGEIYKGTDSGDENITIRIAEHSENNEECPNSWCYQELLEVPRSILFLVE